MLQSPWSQPVKGALPELWGGAQGFLASPVASSASRLTLGEFRGSRTRRVFEASRLQALFGSPSPIRQVRHHSSGTQIQTCHLQLVSLTSLPTGVESKYLLKFNLFKWKIPTYSVDPHGPGKLLHWKKGFRWSSFLRFFLTASKIQILNIGKQINLSNLNFYLSLTIQIQSHKINITITYVQKFF